MDKEKFFVFLTVFSVVFMFGGSALSIFGSINENTAIKIVCILIGGALSVLSVVCAVLAITVRDEK